MGLFRNIKEILIRDCIGEINEKMNYIINNCKKHNPFIAELFFELRFSNFRYEGWSIFKGIKNGGDATWIDFRKNFSHLPDYDRFIEDIENAILEGRNISNNNYSAIRNEYIRLKQSNQLIYTTIHVVFGMKENVIRMMVTGRFASIIGGVWGYLINILKQLR